jgi:DNA-directed RNA polymerase specialized sigma24 family protein
LPDPRFLTTSWSLVLGGGAVDVELRRRALERLGAAYWYPLYAYLRRRGRPPERAADLVQGLFARLLANDGLAQVGREGGRFRTWLLTALQNHERDEVAHERAERRGGGRLHVTIDTVASEERLALQADETTGPEALFERTWARAVLARAREALEAEWVARGREAEFQALSATLDGAVDAEPRASLGARVGLSPVALRVTVHRLRQRYRDLVVSEVRETLGAGESPGAELQVLLAALRGDSPLSM